MNPASALRYDQAGQKPGAVALRGHLGLTQENQSNSLWCGPAAFALVAGQSHAAAWALLRAVTPSRYVTEAPFVTAYWRDLLGSLDRLNIAHVAMALPERQQTLLAMVWRGLLVG